MNIFVKTTPAPKPKTRDVQKVAYMYSFLLIVFVLCQLYSFDTFVALLEDFMLPGGDLTARLAGAMIIISELFALPFLLGMNLSPLARIISMFLGWVVPIFWFKMAIWLMVTINAVSNIGYLGTVVQLTPGWWAVFFPIAMGALAAWASWGMWPITAKTKL